MQRCGNGGGVFKSSYFGMSLVNYDLQNTVDNDTNSLYFSNSAAQLKQPSGVSKTAVSEHSITFSAVRYRLILEGSKEF